MDHEFQTLCTGLNNKVFAIFSLWACAEIARITPLAGRREQPFGRRSPWSSEAGKPSLPFVWLCPPWRRNSTRCGTAAHLTGLGQTETVLTFAQGQNRRGA